MNDADFMLGSQEMLSSVPETKAYLCYYHTQCIIPVGICVTFLFTFSLEDPNVFHRRSGFGMYVIF